MYVVLYKSMFSIAPCPTFLSCFRSPSQMSHSLTEVPWNCWAYKLMSQAWRCIFYNYTLASLEGMWKCRGMGWGWVTVTSRWLSGREWVPADPLWPYIALDERTEGRKSSVGSSCHVINDWMFPNCEEVHCCGWETLVGPCWCQTIMDIGSGPVYSTSLKGGISGTRC